MEANDHLIGVILDPKDIVSRLHLGEYLALLYILNILAVGLKVSEKKSVLMFFQL